MKRFKIAIKVLLLALIVFTNSSCKKETKVNEVSSEQYFRNPIAVYDNHSGLINTFVDADTINKKLNEKFLKDKDDASRFVVESVEIIDSLPRDENVAGEIKITILDTEEEYSYSIWGMKSFIVKDVQEDKVDYYLNDDLANGIAEFAFKGGDIYYVASRVGDSLSIHEVDSLTYVSTPWIIFYCKSINCLSSCEKGGQWYLGWCRQCPYNNGQCSQESILPIVLEVIGLVLAAITIILML